MIPFSRVLFWDCDPDSLDVEKHRLFIIGLVLTRGKWSDWQTLKKFYNHDTLAKEVVQIRDLDTRTLAFSSVYFDIGRDQFRCSSARSGLLRL